MKLTQRIMILGSVFAVSGCVLPKSNVVSQAINGRVVDSVTGSPVSRARVMKTDLPQTATYTNSNGKFHVRQVSSLHLRVIDPANEHVYPPPKGSSTFLHITHEGYQDQRFDIFGIGNRRYPNKPQEVGTVYLVPK